MNTRLGISPQDSNTPKGAPISFSISLTEAAREEQVFLCSQDEAANLQAKPAPRGSGVGAGLIGDQREKPGPSFQGEMDAATRSSLGLQDRAMGI